ncbi:hypothetical protein PCASD_04406 [Puccinia coronata f. sp. avenae]|uniref:Uncharacterized protein n=1 Tax=Puccinia coronata f. sp. avenae TaxID=200324 RepID=A0A2N5VBT2_9BASI|nr:hypothetical protein PCASD_04406 [Puccinia coronata f. sp. avenae]
MSQSNHESLCREFLSNLPLLIFLLALLESSRTASNGRLCQVAPTGRFQKASNGRLQHKAPTGRSGSHRPTGASPQLRPADPLEASVGRFYQKASSRQAGFCYELSEPVTYFSMVVTKTQKTQRPRPVLLSVSDPNILQDLPMQRQGPKKPEPNTTIQTRFNNNPNKIYTNRTQTLTLSVYPALQSQRDGSQWDNHHHHAQYYPTLQICDV